MTPQEMEFIGQWLASKKVAGCPSCGSAHMDICPEPMLRESGPPNTFPKPHNVPVVILLCPICGHLAPYSAKILAQRINLGLQQQEEPSGPNRD